MEFVGRFAGGARTTELPPTHHVAGATATELDDVSCVSARICMAVWVSWSETVPGRQFLLKRSG